MVEKCAQLFDQLQKRFSTKNKNQSPPRDDRTFVIAACHSWFSEYRDGLVKLGVSDKHLLEIDGNMRSLISIANSSARRGVYQKNINNIRKVSDKFITEAQVAEWIKDKNSNNLGDLNVIEALRNLDEDLERRYNQVLSDLNDQQRISYAGTANELREIIRIILSKKAPTDRVMKMPWFKTARVNDKNLPSQPTQAERVRFILEFRKSSKNAVEQAQGQEQLIDALIGKIVRSSYSRINAGVHATEDNKEIERCLRYANAFLLDIL